MISDPQHPRTIPVVIAELAILDRAHSETADPALLPEIRALERELNILCGRPEPDPGPSTLLCRVWDLLAVNQGVDLILCRDGGDYGESETKS